MMTRLSALRIVCCFLLLATLTWAETINGRVVGVSDGDTITVLIPEKTQMKVRLYGIDAPESKQAFGQRSKQSLSDLVFGKEVRVEKVNQDRYGRTVAWVFVGEINANDEQVSRGMAWWYVNFAKRETRLRDLEQQAQKEKRGLWSEPNPTPPWEFRRAKQKN